MSRQHQYKIGLLWQGNSGEGTKNYRSYKRDYIISAKGKTDLAGSSDPSFRGDSSKYNPEELLVASLSACHMLWYLHLCSERGIIVEEYADNAEGIMNEDESGAGTFSSVILKPQIKISDGSKIQEAMQLHKRANELCFIANSVNFEVKHEPAINGQQ